VIAAAAACGGNETRGSFDSTQEYIDQLDELLAKLARQLDASGEEQQTVDTVGPSAWQDFREELGRLEPPPSLKVEHTSFVEAVDALSMASTDGLAHAEEVTEACRTIETRSIALGAFAELQCD
jgi:hypothetical protein